MSKHTENAITLAANMMHDARNGVSAEIGSGIFSPDELRMGAEMLRAAPDLLEAALSLRNSPYWERISPAKQDAFNAAIAKSGGAA